MRGKDLLRAYLQATADTSSTLLAAAAAANPCTLSLSTALLSIEYKGLAQI